MGVPVLPQQGRTAPLSRPEGDTGLQRPSCCDAPLGRWGMLARAGSPLSVGYMAPLNRWGWGDKEEALDPQSGGRKDLVIR